MGVLKRVPLILLFLFLVFVAWVLSPFWTSHLPASTQQTFAGSTNLAKKVNNWMTGIGQPHQASFKPAHYTGIPKGAAFIANFSVDLNVDSNEVAHPILNLNGNVLTPPVNDTKDQFQIQYPGHKASLPTMVPETTWVAYLKAHPKMFVQVTPASGHMDVWLMADQQWWTKKYAGKVNTNGATVVSSSSSNPWLVGANLSGDKGFSAPQ